MWGFTMVSGGMKGNMKVMSWEVVDVVSLRLWEMVETSLLLSLYIINNFVIIMVCGVDGRDSGGMISRRRIQIEWWQVMTIRQRDIGTTDAVIRRTMSSTVGDDVVEVIVGDGRNLITVIVIIMKANSACDRVAIRL
jgi:hypothetical protein